MPMKYEFNAIEWSCIIYIYIIINYFIIQTGRIAQCNFLTYMYYG
jgi:hypothetical protein